MSMWNRAWLRSRQAVAVRWQVLRDRPEAGDVPGWVMITIMTAGIVLAIWAVAGPQLSSLFSNAMDSVVGGP